MSDRIMSECSKQGKRRAKMEKASIRAALARDLNQGAIQINPNKVKVGKLKKRKGRKQKGKKEKGLLCTPELANIGENDIMASPVDYAPESMDSSPEVFPEKNQRGAAKCDTVATESSKRMKVNFNGRGQPIDDESNKLVSFVGANVRKMADMTIHDWRKVSPSIKESLWIATKQKFILKEEARDYVMKDVGCLWRLAKSRLHSLIDACDNESDLRKAKPNHVSLSKWKSLISLHRSRAFQEKRSKFRRIRSKNILPHTTGRQGYARLEANMIKESSDPSSITRSDIWIRGHTRKNGEPTNAEVGDTMKQIQKVKDKSFEDSSTSLKDDALSQVLGPEPSGHVRALGFGVTPSKVGIITQHKEKVVRLEQQDEELTKKVTSMESTRQDLEEEIRQQMQESIREEMREAIREEMQGQISTMQSLVNQLMKAQGYQPMFETPSSAHQANFRNKDPLVVKCKLFRLDEEDVVAEGCWVTDHPDIEVQGIKLGSGASKVVVEHVVEPRAKLWRQCNGMKMLEDAIGSSIAWPTDHIIKEVSMSRH